MYYSVIMSGFGGQGVMLIGELLAHTAMRAGLNVTWMPSYGAVSYTHLDVYKRQG